MILNTLKLIFTENTNIFNGISLSVGALGGVLAWLFGGFDTILIAFVALVVLDYLTGVIKAIYLKKLSSEVGYKGIIKKVMMFIIIGMSVIVQTIMPKAVPLREVTIIFFICNEGLSILENASEIIPVPKKIKSVLLQLRKSGDDKSGAADGNTSQDAENSPSIKPRRDKK